MRPIDADAIFPNKCVGVIENDGSQTALNIIAAINSAPTLDYAPVRHGEWLLRHVGHGHYWECSECHTNPCIYVTENTKFCPNCGAKMDGGEIDK